MNKLDNSIEILTYVCGNGYMVSGNDLCDSLEILKCVKELLSENNISAMTASYLKLEEVVK